MSECINRAKCGRRPDTTRITNPCTYSAGIRHGPCVQSIPYSTSRGCRSLPLPEVLTAPSFPLFYICMYMCLTYWYCLYIVDSSSNSQTPALLHTYIHKTTILEVPLLLLLLLPPHRIRVCACRYGHTV